MQHTLGWIESNSDLLVVISALMQIVGTVLSAAFSIAGVRLTRARWFTIQNDDGKQEAVAMISVKSSWKAIGLGGVCTLLSGIALSAVISLSQVAA